MGTGRHDNVALGAVAMRRPWDRRRYRRIFRQRLGKHFPAAKRRRATVEGLLETWVFLCGPCRLEGNWGDPVNSVWQSVKKEHKRM
jgi:hypothetical protein